ncbi:MAG: hypothetical protein M1819_000604 [Sarea resinae]|nr:MAG: hypothetical protein M1819_000604 [Sarea resinae]
MSEPIPESVPTSSDPRSKRPVKRRALTPISAQANELDALFAKPDREIVLPPSSSSGGALSRPSAIPPEIVANVQGSSAGAGSGEFHVYKASRRREYERLRAMDEEVRREKEDGEFERRKEELRRRDERKTNKNKARREKMKARKGKGGKGSEDDGAETKAQVPLNAVGVADGGQVGRAVASNMSNGDGKNVARVDNPEEIGIIIHDD